MRDNDDRRDQDRSLPEGSTAPTFPVTRDGPNSDKGSTPPDFPIVNSGNSNTETETEVVTDNDDS